MIKFLICLVFITLLSSPAYADSLTLSGNSFNVEIIPHYFRNNIEISYLSLNQSFDALSLSINVSSINQISSIQMLETNNEIFTMLHFYDNNSIYNSSKIIAYTDRLNIINHTYGDILNFSIVLSARDTSGNILYGIGKKSVQIGRIEKVIPKQDSNNYLFYLIILALGILFFYYLGNKSGYKKY